MTPHPRTLVTAAAVGLLMAGCTPDPAISPTPIPAAPSASASTTASPSPTSTLSPAKQQAVDQATGVILTREQLTVELLAAPDPKLNDLNDLVTQPQLDRDLKNMRMLIGARETVIESTGPVTIASVDPVKIDLKGDPPTVVLEVCLDSTATSGMYKGEAWTGKRELLRYRVVQTSYLPAPGWAIAQVLPPRGHDQPQPC